MAPIISIWRKLFSFGESDGARKKAAWRNPVRPQRDNFNNFYKIVTRCCYMQNMNALALMVCHKKILKDFFLKFYVK